MPKKTDLSVTRKMSQLTGPTVENDGYVQVHKAELIGVKLTTTVEPYGPIDLQVVRFDGDIPIIHYKIRNPKPTYQLSDEQVTYQGGDVTRPRRTWTIPPEGDLTPESHELNYEGHLVDLLRSIGLDVEYTHEAEYIS